MMLWKKKRKKKQPLTPEEKAQRKTLARNAAEYSMFAANTQPSAANLGLHGKGGGFDISNAQKIAAYNLLINTRDDD